MRVEADEPVSDDDDLAALRFLNSLPAAPVAAREPWPASDIAGRITRETLDRVMELFLRPVHLPQPPADYSGLIDAMRWPGCTARLFVPDEAVKNAFRDELIMRSIPVHPSQIGYFDPAQGPAPLACVREPHPEGTWHHDGRGTWFR